MNYYHIIYRLDSDQRGSKRSWEDFADDKDHAVQLLAEYVLNKFNGGQTELFNTPHIVILSFSEYLDVFK